MSTRQLVEDALNLEDNRSTAHVEVGTSTGANRQTRRKCPLLPHEDVFDDAIRDLAHVLLSERTLPDDPFTISFGEFPERVVADGLARVHVVVGTTQRERLGRW